MPDDSSHASSATDYKPNDIQRLNNSDSHGLYKNEAEKSQQATSKADTPFYKASEVLVRDLDIFLGLNHGAPKNWDDIEKELSDPILKTTLPDFSDCDMVSNDSQSDEQEFEEATVMNGETSKTLKVESFKQIHNILRFLPSLKDNGVILDPSKYINAVVFWNWDGTTHVQLDESDLTDDSKYDFVYLCLKKGMRVTLMARHRGWVYGSTLDTRLQGWFPWYMLVDPAKLAV